MASCIVEGLSRLLVLNGKVEAALMTVCDQPFVSAQFIKAVNSKAFRNRKGIVACT